MWAALSGHSGCGVARHSIVVYPKLTTFQWYRCGVPARQPLVDDLASPRWSPWGLVSTAMRLPGRAPRVVPRRTPATSVTPLASHDQPGPRLGQATPIHVPAPLACRCPPGQRVPGAKGPQSPFHIGGSLDHCQNGSLVHIRQLVPGRNYRPEERE